MGGLFVWQRNRERGGDCKKPTTSPLPPPLSGQRYCAAHMRVPCVSLGCAVTMLSARPYSSAWSADR